MKIPKSNKPTKLLPDIGRVLLAKEGMHHVQYSGSPIIYMKDSYWFKHDSTAGRDLKMMQIKAIYKHEGIGVYWEIIEVLREQRNYIWKDDAESISVLAKILGIELPFFERFLSDCKRVELFKVQKGYFFSERLIKDMEVWESKKNNRTGKKRNDNESVTIPEDKINKKKEEKKFVPPLLENVSFYFKENGYRRDVAIKAFNYYNEAGWKDSKGNQVRNWKQKMISVWFKDEHKLKPEERKETMEERQARLKKEDKG